MPIIDGFAPQPTKSIVKHCYIHGIDITRHINKVSLYETICKPYITAKLTVMDSDNALDGMYLIGAEPVQVEFQPYDFVDNIYDANLKLHGIKGNQSTQNLRTVVYQVDLIGDVYFKNMASVIQKSLPLMTGTEAIRTIHGMSFGGGLTVLEESLGMLSKEAAHNINSYQPLKAIADLSKKLVFGSVKSGSVYYFKNRFTHVLAPLESLLAQSEIAGTFVQKNTWGASWPEDLYTAMSSIIAAKTEMDDTAGRMKMGEVLSATKQSQKLFDLRSKKGLVDQMAETIGGEFGNDFLGNLVGGGDSEGGVGGRNNFGVMNSSQTPSSSVDQSAKTASENMYQAAMMNGPIVTIKVPLQSGIKVTVGQNIIAKLLPPAGDLDTPPTSSWIGGKMLVADLCHELYLDDHQMNGTTTMKCIRGGYNIQ